MTDLYDRQKDLNLHIPSSAIIVGVGGTGSWVALLLVMSGVKQLTLMDSDRLELTNFNRLPLPVEGNIGDLKTEALARFLNLLRPDCYIITEGRATGFTLSAVEGEVLFDCTDQQSTQRMLKQWAQEHKISYIRVGYDGTHVTISDRVPSWNSLDKERSGYAVFPSWSVPAALAGCLGVAKAMYAPDIDVSADIKTLGGKKRSEEVLFSIQP